jgi:hypothetical protein
MRIASNLLFLERILVHALGINTLRSAKIMKSRIGEEYLFLQSRTIATKTNVRLNDNRRKLLDDMLDCVDNDKDKIVVQISLLEFTRLSNWCSAIAKEIQERNFSLVIVVQDFSTMNLEIGINPFKAWSMAFGLSFSQHPKLPSIFLVDYEYRFHEISGKLSRYEEIRKTFQITDKNHTGILYFVMEEELVKRLETNDTYLLETIKDLNNFEEIHSSSLASNSRNGGIYCDETGIFIRRRYVTGTTLRSFLEFDSPKNAAKLLLLACSKLSKMGIFPNDLRPWNLVYEQNQCRLIDFPKNINCDDDTNGIPNFISLLIVLDYLKEFESETFEAINSKFLNSICLHAEIYNPDSFVKLELAWLNLEKYISSIILFAEGRLEVEAILYEVFNE